MNEKTVIEFRVKFPLWIAPDRVMAIEIDAESARCMLPLPRDHDAPFDFGARLAAKEQRKERERLRGHVTKMIDAALDKLFAEEDTVHGFKKNERAPMRFDSLYQGKFTDDAKEAP